MAWWYVRRSIGVILLTSAPVVILYVLRWKTLTKKGQTSRGVQDIDIKYIIKGSTASGSCWACPPAEVVLA